MNPLTQIFNLKALIFATTAIMLMVSCNQAIAQYSVAPNAFVIETPSRSTEMFIRMSPDAAPMEFEIRAYFAVPGTDSSGNFKLFEFDSLAHRDASPYLRFSPRRFILNPGEQQVVRITITSDSLPDGEYWSRIMASAKMVTIINSTMDQGLTASMGLEIRTVSGLLYRKGKLSSGIDLGDRQAFVKNDSLFVDLQISKASLAAWLGTVTISVLDANDAMLRQQSMPTNVYVASGYRYAVPLHGVESGQYSAHITFATQRDDPSIPLIKAPDVSAIIPFVVTNQSR
jgi:hypothetical protein